MTHTSHPYGFRLGITKKWRSQWFSSNRKKYQELIKEDHLIRTLLEKELKDKMVSSMMFEREKDAFVINIRTARPGLIIGKEGFGIEDLITRIKKFARKNKLNENIKVKIEEVRYIEQDATLVAESIVESLKKQAHYRRLMKYTIDKVIASRNVFGCKLVLSGRLGGAEIARTEQVKKGKIPLQTLRADIDYAHKEAILAYGIIGVKVWIYKGEVNNK